MTDHYERRCPVTGEPRNPIESSRYLEIPTFMRAPWAESLDELDVALVGVPFDAGSTNRAGSRHGPREVRNQSSNVRRIHPVSRFDPFAACRIADVGDVMLERPFDLEAANVEIEAFFRRLRAAGVVPLAIGGDHSISYPILAGTVADEPVGLIQIDAHTDTWDVYRGARLHHGAPFRWAIDDGLVDPSRSVQIGIRGPQTDPEGWNYSKEQGLRVMFMHEIDEMPMGEVVAEVRRVVGDGPVYLTFDIDGLDPAFAPGTGTPEIGGLSTREALALVRGLRGLDFVGADLVEVSPPFDPSGLTALTGASLAYELLCLVAESVVSRRDV